MMNYSNLMNISFSSKKDSIGFELVNYKQIRLNLSHNFPIMITNISSNCGFLSKYMGSQQIFLIVLTLMLISLAIFSGFQFVNEHYKNSDREILVEQVNFLYNTASKYRKKLVELGGGSGSYEGWEIPSNNIIGAENTTFRFLTNSDKIVFCAERNKIGWDNKRKIKIWVRYSDKNGRTVRFLN